MASFTSSMVEEPILHVLVIGFHHKKGCQVEYAYPPTGKDENLSSTELPEQWKHLPSLALPDGAHNYEEDTVYFHLPSISYPKQTVYGISCYRQMNAEKLLHKSSDITRGSVQKSVCVLSILPLYGLIQAKLELITHAYFDERDFTKVSLLEETYKNLNASLSKDMVDGTQAFLGLSIRDVVLNFKHKAVLLFKLLLLERKVLFSKSPVKDLCAVILSICSLYPGMIEKGLTEAAANIANKQYSSELRMSNEHDYLEVHVMENNNDIELNNGSSDLINKNDSERLKSDERQQTKDNYENFAVEKEQNISNSNTSFSDTKIHSELDMKTDQNLTASEITFEEEDKLLNEIDEVLSDNSIEENDVKNNEEIQAYNRNINKRKYDETSEESAIQKNEKGFKDEFNMNKDNVLMIETDNCGFPLSIFTKGSLCHPYLSLPFLDLLSDVNTRSFVVGATNVLFKQKKYLFDVIVEIDEVKIEITDLDLRNQLHLTTEDLRFADHIVRHVMDDTEDVFLDGTGWEGGDEWLRAQFKAYLMSLLRTSDSEGSKEYEAFNPSFMNAWKTTHNYKIWSSVKHPGIFEINPGHPFHGQMNMADMRLRIYHTMQNTERGRKLNQVVSSTGKVVSQTSKVVGGAISSAKSVVSSWWSHLGTPPIANEHTRENEESMTESNQ